jgi:bifunctional non-homologous end joining protein LigD
VRWGHTAVAPYSVRAKDGAPVATPLEWSELDDDALSPRGWNVHTLPGRLEQLGGDPWAEIGSHAAGLGKARKALKIG